MAENIIRIELDLAEANLLTELIVGKLRALLADREKLLTEKTSLEEKISALDSKADEFRQVLSELEKLGADDRAEVPSPKLESYTNSSVREKRVTVASRIDNVLKQTDRPLSSSEITDRISTEFPNKDRRTLMINVSSNLSIGSSEERGKYERFKDKSGQYVYRLADENKEPD